MLTVLVTGGALAYVGLHLRRHWDALQEHAWSVDPWLLAASFALLSSWFLLRARLWQMLVRQFGGQLAYRQALRIWAISELGRYVPGKVLYVAARPALASRVGVRASVAVAAMAVELALVMLTSAGLFILPLWTRPALGARYGLAVVLLWVLLAAAVPPRVLSGLLNFGLRRLGKEEVEVRLNLGQLLRLLALCVVLWAGMGLAFFVFTRSVWPAVGWHSVWTVAGAYALAWTLGLATLVSPGGLGVREAILVTLLSGVLTPGGAALVAIASRIWITLAELTCAGMAAALGRKAGPRSQEGR